LEALAQIDLLGGDRALRLQTAVVFVQIGFWLDRFVWRLLGDSTQEKRKIRADWQIRDLL